MISKLRLGATASLPGTRPEPSLAPRSQGPASKVPIQSARMPTAAKLFAAVGLAAVAFFTAEIIKPHMENGTQFGAFTPLSVMIGVVCGWRILGPEVGRGWYSAANSGIKAAVFLLGIALFLFSTHEMLVLALRRSYDAPMEAVVDIVSIGVDYLRAIFAPDVAISLFGGAILAGLLSEWATRRWR